jgi:hypothetical protein
LDLFHLSNDFTFQGVPAGAVRHKMIGEGLDQATIEYISSLFILLISHRSFHF